MSLSVRAALAAAARSRGYRAPQDAQLATVRSELEALDVSSVDLAGARRRLAEIEGDEAILRERIAAQRGRVQALRERGEDASDAESALADAVGRHAEVATERIAAEQALERACERAREARDRRERRLRLEDRLGNLRRAAREYLARQVADRFERAIDSVPGEGALPDDPASFRGDSTAAALAVARIAALSAPVVLSCRRFDAPVEAAACLDAPVILLETASGRRR